MKNVLFVSAYLAQNGTEMFMMNVLRNSNPEKIHFDFLINSNAQTPNKKEAEEKGCSVYVIPFRREGFFRSISSCWKFFKVHAKQYDAVHWCGGNLSSIDSLIIAKYFKIPIIIIHAHSSSVVGLHNRLLHNFHRLIVRRLGTHFLACSTQAASFFFGNHPSVIINNGIDVDKFDFNGLVRDRMRRELGISKDSLVIGHVGRFDDNKNQLFLLYVFKELLKTERKASLLLIGEGVNFEKVKEAAAMMGLQDAVLFLGLRNDVNELMQAMDCFVMPSKFEGLPFVLVEAQCSGLPCVISDTINRDVDLTDNVTYVSLEMQPDFWAGLIIKNIRNYERGKMGWKIREKGFSIKDCVSYLEGVYSSSN